MTETNKTALVVAHPDDEALWFSSVLREVDHTILCFLDASYAPNMAAGRHQALARYPLASMICLSIEQAAVIYGADWAHPKLTDFGLAVRKSEYTYEQLSEDDYRENFARLKDALRPRLNACSRVYTHSPWGEYAHEEHVQVYRAVKALQAELAFEIWVPNYCSNRSYPLLRRYLEGARPEVMKRATDKALARTLMQLYKETHCWTWFDDYEWPDEECFFLDSTLAPGKASVGHCLPLNFIEMPAPRKREQKRRRSLGARIKHFLGR